MDFKEEGSIRNHVFTSNKILEQLYIYNNMSYEGGTRLNTRTVSYIKTLGKSKF
jgi:hypothetical protein